MLIRLSEAFVGNLSQMIHPQNCTRKECWSIHYDECFPDGSEVYARPDAADSADRGFILRDSPVVFARLQRRQTRR